MTTQYFLELRQRLVECRTNLRAAKDTFEIVRAQREQAAIDSGQANGSNAEARARSLTIALAADTLYVTALSGYRVCEAECERVEALLEAARDERRHGEWQIRARLADALLGVSIPADGADPAGDDAFDNTLTQTIDDYLTRARRSVYMSDPFEQAMRVG